MSLDWLEDNEEAVVRAGVLGKDTLSWLARGDGESSDDGTLGFIASTPTIDRVGDSIDQQTWLLANFRLDPVFLADHDRTKVIGTAVKVGRTAGEDGSPQLRIRVRFDESDLNPTGQLYAYQHRNGFRHAVSVGFRPREAVNRTDLPSDHPLHQDPKTTPRWAAGYLYRHNELLEVSSVSVPCNPQALQLSAELANAESVDAAIKRALDDTVPSQLRTTLLDLLRRDAEVRSVILAAFMAAPSSTGRKATTNTGGDDLAHLWSK
jgi:hypothetical protein